jgi:hypothetical protein
LVFQPLKESWLIIGETLRFWIKYPQLEVIQVSKAIDSSHKEMIRHFIRNANQNGQYITLSKLAGFIKENKPESK